MHLIIGFAVGVVWGIFIAYHILKMWESDAAQWLAEHQRLRRQLLQARLRLRETRMSAIEARMPHFSDN